MFRFLCKDRIVAPPGFNRWLVPPAAIAMHLCIGSVYAWSIFEPALTRVRGVVAPAAGDWSTQQVTWVFSVAILCLGVSAAFAGQWLERVGPRLVGIVAACCWGGGFLIGSAGIALHQLWLLYFGYGVIGGCGLGLAYVSPVSMLIRWFPDHRGMATGMAIMGFGGGAFIGAPLKEWLLAHLYRAPADLGLVSSFVADAVQNVGGALNVLVNHTLFQVVSALGPDKLQHFYQVDTGNIGAVGTFIALGVLYFLVMVVAAFMYRVPAEGWKPAGWTPDASTARHKMISNNDVHIDRVMRTAQFYLLWIVLCFNVTAGISIISVAKTMMKELFSTALPGIVNAKVNLLFFAIPFTALYVQAVSLFNMLGRFGWASISDHLGRKRTYLAFFVLGAILYLSVPYWAKIVSSHPSPLPLICFYAVTMIIFTMYGGSFATMPAYVADIFGTRYVGVIYGRILTAWSAAGVLGPWLLTTMSARAINRACADLASRIDPAIFRSVFHAGKDQLPSLISAHTVTIAKLMALSPQGTSDPSASVYNAPMFLMAGLLVLGLIANALIRPVDAKHHMT